MPSNTYRHPHAGIIGRLIERIANSSSLARMRRAVLSRVPFLKLESDVTDVVYLTWLVPVGACKPFIPRHLQIWERNGLTPFTVLTYRHGHFGPEILGPLRRLLSSPLQSNWRLYLAHAPEGAPRVSTVLFLKNVMDSLPHAVGTRLFSDALLTHYAAEFVHVRDGDLFKTQIAAGLGSSPSLVCSVKAGHDKSLSPSFASIFGSWQSAIEFLACQDAAVTSLEGGNRIAFTEIDLPIDPLSALPAALFAGQVECSMLETLQPTEPPLCFVLPRVRFKAVSERLL